MFAVCAAEMAVVACILHWDTVKKSNIFNTAVNWYLGTNDMDSNTDLLCGAEAIAVSSNIKNTQKQRAREIENVAKEMAKEGIIKLKIIAMSKGMHDLQPGPIFKDSNQLRFYRI